MDQVGDVTCCTKGWHWYKVPRSRARLVGSCLLQIQQQQRSTDALAQKAVSEWLWALSDGLAIRSMFSIDTPSVEWVRSQAGQPGCRYRLV